MTLKVTTLPLASKESNFSPNLHEVGIEKAFLVDSESTWLLYHLH